jgi:hypothetical protein
MAENIEKYLTNFLTLEEQQPKGPSCNEALERRSNPTYKMDNSSFFIRTQ